MDGRGKRIEKTSFKAFGTAYYRQSALTLTATGGFLGIFYHVRNMIS